MLPTLLVAGLLGASACHSDMGPSGPPAVIGGSWRVSEVISDPSHAVTCSDAGILSVTQTTGTFTATVVQAGTCVTPNGAVDNSGSTGGSGQVSGNTISFEIPPCQYHGSVSGTPPDAASGSVSCAVNGLSLSGTWHATRGGDVSPPAVSATETGPAGDSTFVPGDTIQLTLTASDDQQVAWVGYRLGAPALGSDSVAVSGTQATHSFAVATSANWTGDLMVFARDASGTPTQVDRVLQVWNGYIRHPTHAAALDARVRDMAYDAKRNVLYLSQPDSQRVAVLSLGTYAYGAPLVMPSVPAGLDLTPGGDTLLVALRRAAALAVVDLTQAGPSVDTARLAFDTSLGRGPDALRVMSNGKAIVALTCDGIGFGGAVLDYTIATRASRMRSDAPYGGIVTCSTVLASSVDRSALLLLIWDTCCPVTGAVYQAASDTFAVQNGTVGATQPPTSADGNRFLIGGTVFTSALTRVTTLLPDAILAPWQPAAIAPDGLSIYVADPSGPGIPGIGYAKIRVSDGTVLERVRLPAPATRLTALSDGHTLIAEAAPLPFSAQTSRLYVVTLP